MEMAKELAKAGKSFKAAIAQPVKGKAAMRPVNGTAAPLKAPPGKSTVAKSTPAKPAPAVPDDTPIIALKLNAAKLSPPMAAYFKKCQDKLGFVPNVLAAYAFDMAKLECSRRSPAPSRDSPHGVADLASRAAGATWRRGRERVGAPRHPIG